jgi:hypothetical protein
MQIHARPEIHAMDLVAPILVALLYICACSFFREPNRRNFNAIMIAGSRLRQSHVYSARRSLIVSSRGLLLRSAFPRLVIL